jgi:hypothetical protein
MEAFYVQEDFRVSKNLQINAGLRWDYQQADGDGVSYLKLNNFKDNMAPRIGFIWDFTGKGKRKMFANWAKYIETPLPLDINVRAGSDTAQTDKQINISTLNSPAGSYVVTDIGNLGAKHTPIDAGLKPQDVRESSAGLEYEIHKDLTVSFRGIYRNQGNVIEDGSFDNGTNYFIFNPGRRGNGQTTEDQACLGGPGHSPQCFGFARRYYRGLELTATKRFTNNYQLIASYVYSSLIGNYEGLFRNDNGQSDPNITSLFDLQSLLAGTYGRLPNDRPQQFKFDGSYRTPWKLLVGASFRAQSGIPFNALIPHPIYGNNEGFCNAALGICNPRGTAVVPTVTATQPGFPNVVNSIGSNRTPTTFNLDMNAYYPIKFGEERTALPDRLVQSLQQSESDPIGRDVPNQQRHPRRWRNPVCESVLWIGYDLPVPVVVALRREVLVLSSTPLAHSWLVRTVGEAQERFPFSFVQVMTRSG